MNNKGQNNLKCAELKGRKDNSHNIIAIQCRIVAVFFFFFYSACIKGYAEWRHGSQS